LERDAYEVEAERCWTRQRSVAFALTPAAVGLAIAFVELQASAKRPWHACFS
jgi:hypothetical protein